ncbi:endocuticle structural glycoprotein SgAbd-1-like [Bicyclus anynana]|uniref:Endocuticle structural glycoprotein SgAbd-1-like n=1 Tax=Bicyclus anynana TaxID=110368 RepID=A0A6J1P8E3_BICAN|nr:endocuticle structural glycoprotein SgAbd-1-like [Bicyclus anynana]
MLIIGKLLLVIFTVTGTKSEPQYRISLAENGDYKNFDISSIIELHDVSNSEDHRKVRDATFVESPFPEKIPVTVIYEPEPSTQQDNRNNAYVKVKRRKQAKRLPDNKTTEEIPDTTVITSVVTEAVTERNPSTSPAPRTVVPKTFTKRPPEYNPVFKKIRQRDPVVKIVDEKNFVFSHSGNFHYSFEGGDGTKVSSQGELKTFEDDKTGEAVVGSVFYKDNDGNDVSLSYTADENGYRPHGAHLPTPPPIPPAIARALKYLATATTPEPVTKPSTREN